MNDVAERYFGILRQAIVADAARDIESHLSDAFELGRDLVARMVPPDEMIRIHHESVTRFVRVAADFPADQITTRAGLVLLEASMAYGMIFRERTERHYQAMVDARIEQAQKLEAVGTLAAGIAHDFNNILASIIGFAELVGDGLPEESLGKRNIGQILFASFRARDLVARLLTFARQQPGQAVPVDVVGEIREALALLRVSYSPDLEIHYLPGVERAMVLADQVQIQQVVMNLCINAADAMDRRGVITIHADVVAPESGVNGKAGILLTIADNGHGMIPEVQARIFDPFFTTKAPNKGSGLGLSVVYGIVTHLGGSITVKSRASGVERGSEFAVILPLTDAADGQGEPTAAIVPRGTP